MTEWNCFGSPTPSLPPLERITLGVLRDVRGFLRTRGVTISFVWQQACRAAGVETKFSRERRDRMMLACKRLRAEGLVRYAGGGRWKVAR